MAERGERALSYDPPIVVDVAPANRPDAVMPRSPGRPRLYEPGEERDRILKATLQVLRRNGGEEATVTDILAEAGLSTRSFYRHFETKEDVIRALYERDAVSFGAHLGRRVEATSGPLEALSAWVTEMLGMAYDRRRAERRLALSSLVVMRAVTGTRAQRVGLDVLMSPLRPVLEEGLRTGVFPRARPELDVHAIRALTMEAVSGANTGAMRLTRQEAADYVLSFCEGALGFAPNR